MLAFPSTNQSTEPLRWEVCQGRACSRKLPSICWTLLQSRRECIWEPEIVKSSGLKLCGIAQVAFYISCRQPQFLPRDLSEADIHISIFGFQMSQSYYSIQSQDKVGGYDLPLIKKKIYCQVRIFSQEICRPMLVRTYFIVIVKGVNLISLSCFLVQVTMMATQ